jgi:hypothetical protein
LMLYTITWFPFRLANNQKDDFDFQRVIFSGSSKHVEKLSCDYLEQASLSVERISDRL